MKIVKKKVSELKYAPYNPRRMKRRELEKLKRSIQEFGYVEPLVWNERTGHVVGGNQRLRALRELGVDEVEVVVVDLDEVREKALNLALNKISGEWNTEKLAEVLSEIEKQYDREGIELTGFGWQESKRIIDMIEAGQEEAEEKIVTELGEEYNYVVVYCDNEIDWMRLKELFGLRQEYCYNHEGKVDTKRRGIGRVVHVKKLWRLLDGSDSSTEQRKSGKGSDEAVLHKVRIGSAQG